ncbi:hypothetical protein [Burkholderia ubonensis]|uniref:hypothetical protein n=1 Tax=Burkholderia ubonensis TaxID=101571 RepID=UPI0012F76731|nr:hypothetical protein [Burkholderia ubonensis]
MKRIHSGIRANRNLKYSAALSRVSLRRRKFERVFDAAYPGSGLNPHRVDMGRRPGKYETNRSAP